MKVLGSDRIGLARTLPPATTSSGLPQSAVFPEPLRIPDSGCWKQVVVRLFCRVFPGLAVFTVVVVQAADPDAQLQHEFMSTVRDLSQEHANTFWAQFMGSCDHNLNGLFANQFHPLAVMNWNLRTDNNAANSATGAAGQALSQSVAYGAREATIDLPVVAWLDDHQSWLAGLLRNSFGSVEEEAISPTKLSYQPVEQSWWNRLSQDGNLRYGLRPFKSNPYAFLGWAIRDGDQLLVLSNIRYHYENFADHNFEFALSVPLMNHCSFDLGTSYQFGRHEDQKRLALKFNRALKAGGILNIGFELQKHPVLLAGLAFQW
jgi:hypothetical protein